MISELLVDLFCECRSCFVVRCFGFERFQYTNATGLVYFHRKCSLGKHVPVAPCALHERPDIGSPLAYVGHHCKRPMQCWVAMQTLSLIGQPVSTACFPFSFLDSQQTPSCLFLSLIRCAVDANDVQLGLETD